MRHDERGVSEVVGYVLVFSLILSAITFVSVAGFSSLEDTRDREHLRNAERAFDVLRNNVADIYQLGAPSRATELSLTNAQLQTGDPVEINITVTDGTGKTTSVKRTITPLVFVGPDDTTFSYEAGAVFRDSRYSGSVLYDPPFRIGPERTVLPVIGTQSSQTRSLGGGTVLIRTMSTDRSVPVVASQAKSLSIEITDSPHQGLWNRYLSEEEGLDCTGTGNTVSCEMPASQTPVERLVVSVQEIQWELEQ
jgi:hypothetical protein